MVNDKKDIFKENIRELGDKSYVIANEFKNFSLTNLDYEFNRVMVTASNLRQEVENVSSESAQCLNDLWGNFTNYRLKANSYEVNIFYQLEKVCHTASVLF